MPGDQATLWQKCARLISGNLWGLPPLEDSIGNGYRLSNDQKFADFELRLAGVASQYSNHGVLDESFQAQGGEVADKLLSIANAMISDDILKQSTGADGKYSKVQLLIELADANKQVDVNKMLQPTNVRSDEVTKLATEYNEIMEHLSTDPPEPAYKGLHRVGAKSTSTSGFARQFRRLSQDLWDVLLPSSSCCTTRSHHSAKIELVPSQPLSHNGTHPIHAFICSNSDESPPAWHELQLSMKEGCSIRTIRPLDDFSDLRTLCGIVSACDQTGQALQIQCTASTSEVCPKIIGLEPYEPTFSSELPEVSLATLIDHGHLRYAHCDGGGSFTLGDKAALLRTLAVSLLCFPTQSWLRSSWRAEDVYFLRSATPHLERVKHVDRPYQLIRVTQEIKDADGCDNSYLGSNPFILSFALLVLEITRGERIIVQKNLGSTVWNVLNEMEGSLEKDFKAAIKSCLNFYPGAALAIGNNDEERRIDLIFRKIVRPFEDCVERFGEPIDERELRSSNSKYHIRQLPVKRLEEKKFGPPLTQLKSFSARDQRSIGHSKSPLVEFEVPRSRIRWKENVHVEHVETDTSTDSEFEDELGGAKLYDDTQEYGDERIKAAFKYFIREMDNFNNQFTRSLPTTVDHRAVRVAILDSGISETDKLILGAATRIRGRRSWVGLNRDDTNDTCGHGTHVARAFLRMATRAHIYIARVSEGKKISEAQLEGIAEAIHHAVEEWDVDIISLSLGLDQSHESIEKEIDNALMPSTRLQRSRIIFAAAANGGAGTARAWPAHKPGVICINASDGRGASSEWISPSSVEGEDNFSTLGIGLESRWSRGRVCVSGTSFATPIAAALGACILEIASMTVEMRETQRDWLYSSNGMRALLRRMSSVAGNYRFICPWRPAEGQGPLTPEQLQLRIREVLTHDYPRGYFQENGSTIA